MPEQTRPEDGLSPIWLHCRRLGLADAGSSSRFSWKASTGPDRRGPGRLRSPAATNEPALSIGGRRWKPCSFRSKLTLERMQSIGVRTGTVECLPCRSHVCRRSVACTSMNVCFLTCRYAFRATSATPLPTPPISTCAREKHSLPYTVRILVATQQEYCWHGRIRNLTGRRRRLKAQCNAYGRNRHDYLDHSRPDPDVAFFVMMKERALKRGTLVPKDQESTSTP
jgi:hypothetical protein